MGSTASPRCEVGCSWNQDATSAPRPATRSSRGASACPSSVHCQWTSGSARHRARHSISVTICSGSAPARSSAVRGSPSDKRFRSCAGGLKADRHLRDLPADGEVAPSLYVSSERVRNVNMAAQPGEGRLLPAATEFRPGGTRCRASQSKRARRTGHLWTVCERSESERAQPRRSWRLPGSRPGNLDRTDPGDHEGASTAGEPSRCNHPAHQRRPRRDRARRLRGHDCGRAGISPELEQKTNH